MYGYILFLIYLTMTIFVLKQPKRIIYLLGINYVASVLNRFFIDIGIINIAGVKLYNNDILVLALILIILKPGTKITFKGKGRLWFLLFSIMTWISMLRGVFGYGFTTELFGDLRLYTYYVITIIFFSYVDIGYDLKQYRSFIDKVAIFVLVYTWSGFAFEYIFGIQFGKFNDPRPLVSDQAIVFALYIVYRIYDEVIVKRKGMISFFTLFSIATLIINRYNTTWVALVGGVVVLVIMPKGKERLLTPKLVLQLLLIGACIFPIILGNSENSFIMSLMDTADKFSNLNQGTFETRTIVWKELLSSINGYEIIIGQPFGFGYFVLYMGELWSHSPHNGYIQCIMRMGYLGLIFLILHIGTLLGIAMKQRKYIMVALLTCILIYWVPYSMVLEHGCIIGLISRNLFLNDKIGEGSENA